MILNLFIDTRPQWFEPLLAELRERHSKLGGQPEEFPEYLITQGIIQSGWVTRIDDKWQTYAELTFS